MTVYEAKDTNRKVIAGAMQPVFVGNTPDNLLPIALYDTNSNPLAVDDHEYILVVMDEVHHEVHEGHTFRSWYVTPTTLANDANLNIVMTTTTKEIHIVESIGGGGDFEYYVYRGPTFNGGSALPIHNLDDTSTNVTTVTVVVGPTVTVAGTEIDGEFHPGGAGGNAQGGVIRDQTEDILRTGTSYLFRVINRAGLAKKFSVELQWYEE